jgi:hypothetical protein
VSGNQWFNQNLFTSPTLDPGQHTVTVTFNGDPDINAVPLTVDYFEVATNPSGQHVGNNTSNNGDPGISSSNSNKPKVGAIVGGIIGAIVLLALFGCAVWLFLRRRRQSRGVHEYEGKPYNSSPFRNDQHSSGHIVPFLTSPSSVSAGELSPSSQGGLTSISAGLASSIEGHSAIAGLESSSSGGLSSSHGRLGGSGKGNDRGAVAQRPLPDVGASSSSGHGGTSPTSANSASQVSGPTFVRHQDSGMRIAPEDAQGEVIDLPPDYTLS